MPKIPERPQTSLGYLIPTILLFTGCAHRIVAPPVEPPPPVITHHISQDGTKLTIAIPLALVTSPDTVAAIVARYTTEKAYDAYFSHASNDSIRKLTMNTLMEEIREGKIDVYRFSGLETTGDEVIIRFQEDTFRLAQMADNLLAQYADTGPETVTLPPSPSIGLDDYSRLADHGLLYPCPGVPVPAKAGLLPNAPRSYRNGVHRGIDFLANYGTEVRSVADGVVVRADHTYREITPQFRNDLLAKAAVIGRTPSDVFEHILLGRTVIIDHGTALIPGKRIISVYAHLSHIEQAIQVGAKVKRGQAIGLSGNSGTKGAAVGKRDGAHLHFELVIQDRDGERYLGQGLSGDELYALLGHLFQE